MTCEW
ncbi:hypothetical protein YPPY76_1701, partial [Yersinia pestis PY-76]